jgi:hypothetical protein
MTVWALFIEPAVQAVQTKLHESSTGDAQSHCMNSDGAFVTYL